MRPLLLILPTHTDTESVRVRVLLGATFAVVSTMNTFQSSV